KERGFIGESRRVAEIGAQQLNDEFLCAHELLERVYEVFGRTRINLGNPVGVENFTNLAPSSRPFWLSLGFEYIAIDLAGEDVLKLDLNHALVPPELRDSQDIVLNAGTTEHVANQDNAFRLIHDLTKPNGIMIHDVPCQGNLTHGLVNYTLKFFWHLCREN